MTRDGSGEEWSMIAKEKEKEEEEKRIREK